MSCQLLIQESKKKSKELFFMTINSDVSFIYLNPLKISIKHKI